MSDSRSTALAQATLSLAIDAALVIRAAEEIGERELADDLASMVERLNDHRVRIAEGT